VGGTVTTSVYKDIAKALGPVAQDLWPGLGGGGALLATYAALVGALERASRRLGAGGWAGGRMQRNSRSRSRAGVAIAYAELDRRTARRYRAVTPRRNSRNSASTASLTC